MKELTYREAIKEAKRLSKRLDGAAVNIIERGVAYGIEADNDESKPCIAYVVDGTLFEWRWR